jgi:hypothetical protein
MTKTYSEMTKGQLLKAYTRNQSRCSAATTKLYALAIDGHERYSDICDRLGSDNAVVIAARESEAERLMIQSAIDLKVGPGIANYLFLSVR